jgi:RNA polymerase sigma factor (sigma-70 family)
LPQANNIEENQLIDGCLRQDRQAQRALFEKYKRFLYSKAYRIVNNADQAQDVLQEGFIEIFRDLKTFRQQSSLGTWMKTIVVRKALAHCRMDRQTYEYNPDVHDQAILWPDELTGEYLDKAIRQLPDGYRSVFLLIEVEDYSHKEAAEMLGIKEGTSKSQLFHAKKMLQKSLKELYEL